MKLKPFFLVVILLVLATLACNGVLTPTATPQPTPSPTHEAATSTPPPTIAPTVTPEPTVGPITADVLVGWLIDLDWQFFQSASSSVETKTVTITLPVEDYILNFPVPDFPDTGRVHLQMDKLPDVQIGAVFAVRVMYSSESIYKIVPIAYYGGPVGKDAFKLVLVTITPTYIVSLTDVRFKGAEEILPPPEGPFGYPVARNVAVHKDDHLWYYDPSGNAWIGFGVVDPFSDPPVFSAAVEFQIVPDKSLADDNDHWALVDTTGRVRFTIHQSVGGLEINVPEDGNEWLAIGDPPPTPAPDTN